MSGPLPVASNARSLPATGAALATLAPLTRVLTLPHVKRRLADCQLAAYLSGLSTRLVLLERCNDLLLTVSLLRHVEPPFGFLFGVSTANLPLLSSVPAFWFWVIPQ